MPCRFAARCGVEGEPCVTEADCCGGNPDAGEPTLYCQRATATATNGTCEQCIATTKVGCDTLDPSSCCDGLNTPPAVVPICKATGKGNGACVPT